MKAGRHDAEVDKGCRRKEEFIGEIKGMLCRSQMNTV
jgi:hypothetical protein